MALKHPKGPHGPGKDLAALRVVVKRGFSRDVAEMLIKDLKRQLPRQQRQPEPVHDAASAAGFHR